MKTLQNTNTGVLKREKDIKAQSMVNTGEWKYVPKLLWKQNTRGEELKEAGDPGMTLQNPLRTKQNKLSKAQKRHIRRKK